MVLMEKNRHELDEWLVFWKGKVSPRDQVYAKPVHTWGNQLGYEAEDFVRMYADTPCISPFSSLALHADGKVPICAVDYNKKILVGDFTRQSIEEIWNGSELMEIRQKHLTARRNEIPLCRGCHIWEEDHKVWAR